METTAVSEVYDHEICDCADESSLFSKDQHKDDVNGILSQSVSDGLKSERGKYEFLIIFAISLISCLVLIFLRKTIIFFNLAKSVVNFDVGGMFFELENNRLLFHLPICSSDGVLSPVDVRLSNATMKILYKEIEYFDVIISGKNFSKQKLLILL